MSNKNKVKTEFSNTRTKSIGRWLLLTTMLGTALAFAALMGISSSSSYKNAVEQSTISHTVISELLATQVSGGLRWKKSDVVTQVLNSSVEAVDDNTLVSAYVYDVNNDIWLEYAPESEIVGNVMPTSSYISEIIGSEDSTGEFNGSSFTIAVPVIAGKENSRIGTLVLVWDFRNTQAAANNILMTGALLATVFLAVLIAAQWWAVSRLISKPLRTITSQMGQLAAGDTSINVAGKDRKDEIGLIASAVDVFKQDALQTISIKQQQDAAEQEAERQSQIAKKAEEEKQAEKIRQLEEHSARAQDDAKVAASLKRRIESLLCAVDAVSNGNLSYKIDHGDEQDDLQKVAIALDGMFADLRGSFDQIGARATELTTSAGELKSLSGIITAVADECNFSTSHASETSVRVSASVETVASASQEMGATIKQIAVNASDATTVANKAVQLAESTDVSIRQLADSSRGIGNVIKVINSIAEQTNLLALNATIEAARAGDAGKGFAVVANEVKELAKETATATEEIEKRIDSIQNDTGVAVQAIEDINKIVRQISETQVTIADSVDEQTTTTLEINKTLVDASAANEEINSAMEGVVAQSETTRETAGNVEAAANQLGDVAHALEVFLKKYQYDKAA